MMHPPGLRCPAIGSEFIIKKGFHTMDGKLEQARIRILVMGGKMVEAKNSQQDEKNESAYFLPQVSHKQSQSVRA